MRQPQPSDPSAPELKSGLLLGPDHTVLGAVAVEDITPGLAIGISCGRFPKGYPHVEPNEDAVFAGTNGSTTVLAIADGHNGFEAARAAITAIAAAFENLTGGDPQAITRGLAQAAIDAVGPIETQRSAPRSTSRTALTIAVIIGRSLATATIGDTACFATTRRSARRLASPSDFLSADMNVGKITVDTVSLRWKGAVVLTSDGFLDFAARPRQILRSVATAPASDGVRRLLDAAADGGAGDNVSTAVVRYP